MKKVSALIFCGISMLLFSAVSAQDFSSKEKELISEIKKLMNDDELTDVVEAENSIEEGNFILGQVDNQEFETDKYFAKGSTPKAEKKAINVKAQRIEAARAYDRAFVLMQNAFESRLSKAKWQFDEDKRSADAIRSNSNSKMEESATKSEEYKYLGKDDLGTFLYADLKESINDVNAMYMESLRYQFDAYRMLLGQQEKKQKLADDNFAWGIAQRDNTMESYQTYLGKYSNGNHTEEAQSAIEKFKSGDTPVIIVAIAEEPAVSIDTKVAQPAMLAANTKINTEPVINQIADKVEKTKPAATAAKSSAPAPVATTPVINTYSAPAAEPTYATAMQTATPGVVYKIQIIAVRRELEDAEVTALYSGSENVSFRIEDGLHKYSIGEFSTFAEAREFRKSIDIQNFIVILKDGERVTMSQARK